MVFGEGVPGSRSTEIGEGQKSAIEQRIDDPQDSRLSILVIEYSIAFKPDF